MVDLRRLRQRGRVVGDKDGELSWAHGLPLNGGDGGRKILTDLEDVIFGLISVADGVVTVTSVVLRTLAAGLQNLNHRLEIDLAVKRSGRVKLQLKRAGGRSAVGIRRSRIAADRIGINRCGQLRIQNVHAHPGSVGAVCRVTLGIGLCHVDGILVVRLFCVVGTCCLGNCNQIPRCHDVLVRDVDLIEHHHVRHNADLAGIELDGSILMTGDDLKVPDLIGDGDENGVALGRAVFIDNRSQNFNALAGGSGALQNNRAHCILADAAEILEFAFIPAQRVDSGDLLVVIRRNGGRDADTALVHTGLGVGDRVVLDTPDLSDVTHDGILQRVRRVGHGKIGFAIPVLHQHFARLVVSGRDHLKDLVVAGTEVLAAANVDRAVVRDVAAGVDTCAGEGIDRGCRCQHNRKRERGGATEPLGYFHVHFSLLLYVIASIRAKKEKRGCLLVLQYFRCVFLKSLCSFFPILL